MYRNRLFPSLITVISVILLLTSGAFATTYYVATNGNDNNNGTIGSPFLTIQHAAGIMNAGDTCYVRGGYYHETVTPANSGSAGSPITFQSYGLENVVITGADAVTGWSHYSGNIYRTSIGSNNYMSFEGNNYNQLFCDTAMMLEAQFPNPGSSLLYPTQATVDAGSATVIQDGDLVQASGTWTGALVHCTVGYEWVSITRTCTGNNPNTHEISFASMSGMQEYQPTAGNPYYMSGTLVCLDSAGEWCYDSASGYLYFYAPDGADPGNHSVTLKEREFAFNLNNKAYINVTGFDIHSCTITATGTANHCTIADCRVTYPSHFVWCEGYGTGWRDTGVVLGGSYNTLQSSEVRSSAGNGVSMFGSYNTVSNCLIHDVNYKAVDCACVNVWGNGHLVNYSTLYNSGRAGILLMEDGDYDIQGCCFQYNNIYNYNCLTDDCGGTYTFGTDGQNTSIIYNWVHDGQSPWSMGIYLDALGDNYTANYWVHHNVCWNNNWSGIQLNPNSYYNYCINNTLDSNGYSFAGSGNQYGSCAINNIGQNPYAFGNYITLATNYFWSAPSDPKFVDRANHNYRLRPTTPCANWGTVIQGITDGYTGPGPDLGAYEYGNDSWVPGHTWGKWHSRADRVVLNVLWRCVYGIDRFTTNNRGERDSRTCEGQVAYIPKYPITNTWPLFRTYNATDTVDTGNDADPAGYTYLCTQGYPWTASPPTGTASVMRPHNPGNGDYALSPWNDGLSGYNYYYLGAYGYCRYLNYNEYFGSISGGGVDTQVNGVSGCSLWTWTWNGVQFVNDYDYTRSIGAGLWWSDSEGVLCAPYEGGDTHSDPNTPVACRHGSPNPTYSVANGTMTTRAVPLEKYPDNHGGGTDNPVIYKDLQIGKDFTPNFNSMGPVAKYRTVFYTPNDIPSTTAEVPHIWLKQSFNYYYTYNAETQTLTRVYPSAGTGTSFSCDFGGVIAANSNGTQAFGVYAANTSEGGGVDYFAIYNFTNGGGSGQFDSGASLLNCYRSGLLPSGTNYYNTWLMTDTLANVQAHMRSLYLQDVR